MRECSWRLVQPHEKCYEILLCLSQPSLLNISLLLLCFAFGIQLWLRLVWVWFEISRVLLSRALRPEDYYYSSFFLENLPKWEI